MKLICISSYNDVAFTVGKIYKNKKDKIKSNLNIIYYAIGKEIIGLPNYQFEEIKKRKRISMKRKMKRR